MTAMVMTNSIINMEIYLDDPNHAVNFIVPDVVPDEKRNTNKATRTIKEVGFNIAPLASSFHFEYGDPYDPGDFIFTTKY